MRNERDETSSSIGSFDRNSIGAQLPLSADCTDFMYQWKPMDDRRDDFEESSPLRVVDSNLRLRRFEPLLIAKNVTQRLRKNIMDEYIGWHSQYNRNKIGSISLSFFNDSLQKFTSFIHQRVAENEGAHFSFLNTMFC